MDPLAGTVGPVLLFPDRDDLFDLADEPLSGLERGPAVGRARGDHHADLADRHFPDAVDDRTTLQRPAPAGLGLQLCKDAAGHRGVSLVLQGLGLPSLGHFPHHTQKHDDRPGGGRADAGDSGGNVDGGVREFDHANPQAEW